MLYIHRLYAALSVTDYPTMSLIKDDNGWSSNNRHVLQLHIAGLRIPDKIETYLYPLHS